MREDIDRQLGRRVRKRRLLLGMTQQALGEACGVSFQQIQKYEAAVSRLTAAKLFELAAALGVDVAYFFDGLSAAQMDSSVAKTGQALASP